MKKFLCVLFLMTTICYSREYTEVVDTDLKGLESYRDFLKKRLLECYGDLMTLDQSIYEIELKIADLQNQKNEDL